MTCPNKNHPDWIELVNLIGEDAAYAAFIRNGEEIPNPKDYLKHVNYSLRVVAALNSPKVREPKNNYQGFMNDLKKQGVPDNQLMLIMPDAENKTKEQIKEDILFNKSFAVTIGAEVPSEEMSIEEWDGKEKAYDVYINKQGENPVKTFKTLAAAQRFVKRPLSTTIYKEKSAPGGRGYQELEIRTPDVVPAIQGHSDFSTSKGIGWARVDIQKGHPKVRRVVEIQSDLFQQRKTDILGPTDASNTFFSFLNKDDAWVRFFIKAVVQDSARNGFEKVLFPTGNTFQESTDVDNTDDYLTPTINFYENQVASVLRKLYNVKLVRDDYGNSWNEITIPEDTSILLSLEDAPNLSDIFSDILVPGFNAYTQSEVVNHLTEQVILAVKEDPSKSFNDIFSEYVLWAEDQVLAGNDKFDPIIENIDRFRELVKQKLDRIGLLKGISLDQSEITIEGDTVSDGFYWEDDWVFKFDAKSNAAKTIKEFLLFIPKTELDNGVPTDVLNYLDTVSYMSYDEVFEELKALLADTTNTWDAMKARLEEVQTAKPWIYNLLFQMENYDGDVAQLRNQFVTTFSSTYSASKTILWNTQNGLTEYRIIDTDQSAVRNLILNKWKENFNSEGFYDADLKPTEKVNEVVAQISGLKENPKLLNAWFNSIGINISNTTIDALVKGKISGLDYAQQFKSNRGLFVLIEGRLKAKDKNGVEAEEIINPMVNNSAIRALAAVEAQNNKQVYSNSYRNGEGNTVYSYALPKFMTKQFNRLQNPEYVKQLSQLSFQSVTLNNQGIPLYKNWLNELQTNEEFKNQFNIAPFDTMKQEGEGTEGVRLNNMNDRDLEVTKLVLFQNRNASVKGVGRVANYLFTIPAKTTSYIITASTINPNLSFSRSLGKAAKDALYSTAVAELKRINSVAQRDITVNRYKAGSKYFYFFPVLNQETTPEIWNPDGTVKLPTTIVGDMTVEGIIRSKVEQVFQEDVQKKIDYWKEVGIVAGEKLVVSDRNYLESLKGTDEQNIVFAAADYMLNSMLAEFNLHQMFIGDPAIYFKGNVAKTWDEIGKRLAAMIAPGRDLSLENENEKFISVKVKDRVGNLAVNYAQLKERLGDLVGAYEDLTGTDAQEFTTLKERLFVMYRTGLIDTATFKNITAKADKFGDNLVLTERELKTVFQPDKPVYVETEINSTEDVYALEYVKSSSIPLLPQFTKGLELDTLRKNMEKLEKDQGYTVRLAFDSATKVGGVSSVNIFNEDGTIKDVDFSKYYKVLPRTGFRIQQDVPYDPSYEFVVKATQVTKLLFDNALTKEGFVYNGKSYNGAQLQQVYDLLHKELFEKSHADLNKEILNANGELDIAKIQKLLVKEATVRAYSPSEIASLSVLPDGTFEFPFWATVSNKKYESILTSLYTNNIVKQKMHGNSFVLVTEEGMQGYSKGVTYTAAYEGYLKPMRVEDGVVKPAQVLMPWRFAGNIKEYTGDNGLIDTSKLPEEMMQMFGFRIPNQGHNSMALIEVVGFLPDIMGDALVASRNFITQMGSDFDVDKMYVYNYFTKKEDGKIVKDTEGLNGVKNSLLDIHKSVLLNEDVFNEVVAPLENVKDSESGKYLKKIYQQQTANYLSPDYKKQKYLESVDGKTMVGMESLASTLNSVIQGKKMYLQDAEGEKDYFVIGVEQNGRTVKKALSNLSGATTITGKTKNSVISGDQSGAVDNEKDPILSYINSNIITAPARMLLRQLGLETDYINYLTGQPVIRELVQTARNLDDTQVAIELMYDKVVTAYLNTLSDKDKAEFNIDDLKDYLLTEQELKANLTKPNPLISLVAFLKYGQADHYGQSLQKIQTAINVESSGIGKSILEIGVKTRNVARLTRIQNIANANKVVGNFTTEGIIPTAYSGYLLTEGLFSAERVLGDNELFKYNSAVFKKVLEQYENITGSMPSVDRTNDLWDNMKSYLFANSLYASRKDIFFGNSLAKRVKNFSEAVEGATNPFIARLNWTISPDGKKPDLLTYAAAKEEFLDEIGVYQGLVDLLGNTDEGLRKIGEDLVTYFYINGGIQRAKEWGKYIHPAYLKVHKSGTFLRALEAIDFQNLEIIGTDPYSNEFLKQYLQHKPYLAYQLTNIEKPGDTLVLNEDQVPFYYTGDNEVEVPPVFVSIKDARVERGFRLYQFTKKEGANFNYKRINLLGSTSFLEYGDGNSLIHKKIEATTQVTVIKDVPKADTKTIPTANYNAYQGNLTDVLKKLSSRNPIVSVLKDINFKYTVTIDTSLPNAGRLNSTDKTIRINPAKALDVERTIIHEAVHAATADSLRSVEKLGPAQLEAVTSLKNIADNLRTRLLNNELIDAGLTAQELLEFESLLEQVKKENLTDAGKKRLMELRPKYYGFSQLRGRVLYDEFVAELFTSPEFQEALNKISYDSKKSLLDRIIDLINRILKGFGAKPGTAFDAALREAITLITDSQEVLEAEPYVLLSLNETIEDEYKRLIEQYNSRRKVINQAISTAIINEEKVKAQQLTNRLEELDADLERFEKNQVFSSVLVLANKDLEFVENMLNNPGMSHNDINYSLRILQQWINSPDMLLTEEDIRDANLRFKDIFDIVNKAEALMSKWKYVAKNSLLDAARQESGRATLTKEVLDAQERINAITANMMDISRTGNAILDVMSKWMRTAAYKANLESQKIDKEVDGLIEKLSRNDTFKKEGYYAFAQTADDGESLTGNLVQPLQFAYYTTRDKLIRDAETAGNKNEKAAAWKTYFTWVKNNHTFFEVDKLFTKDDDGFYAYSPDKAYEDQLRVHFGSTFEELLETQKQKIADYNERLTIKMESLTDLSQQQELDKWKLKYDPQTYLDGLFNRKVAKTVDGEYVKSEGSEFVVKRANDKWKDSKFTAMAANPELKAFYDYMVSTMNNLYRFIPPAYKQGANSATIPSMTTSLLEEYNKKGMSAAGTKIGNNLIEAISVANINDKVGSVLDPITGKPEQSLRVRYLTPLSPDEKSYDLGRVLKVFAMDALAFKHKSTVEDSIKLAHSILVQSTEVVRSPNGNAMVDRFGDTFKVKDNKNLISQMEYAMDVFYGHRKKAQGVSNKVVYTNNAKKKVAKLRKELQERKLSPESELFLGEIGAAGAEDENLDQLIENYLNKNKRYVTGSKIGDVFIQIMQLKGMGWNVFGGTTNAVFGHISNMTHAAGGRDFTQDQLFRATRIMLNSTGRTINAGNSTVASKINAWMVKLDVLKELNEGAYADTTNSNRAKRGIEKLAPFELQRRGEYFVQGETMIAMMLNTPITVNGEVTNLWDASNEMGDIPGAEWTFNPKDKESGKKLFEFKFRMDQVVKLIHGNYDPNSPVRIKSGILGRAIMQFRSWIAEGYANRWETKKYDTLLGRERQGRWRTYTQLGFVDSFKILTRLATKRPIDGLGDMVFATEEDKALLVETMKRNLAEIYTALILLGLFFSLKALDFDEDDEWGKKANNFTLNQILRLQDDIQFYYSPLAAKNITQNIVPAFALVVDGSRFVDAVVKGVVEGEWEYKTGKKAGENRILWTGAKLFPGTSSVASLINKVDNEESFRK